MKRVSLGETGMSVSTVALGTWTFAGDVIWGSSDEKRCIRVVDAAIERGITLFDTAPNYGNGRSEEILGKALRHRDNVVVATKFKINGKTAAELKAMVDDSRRRLGRDRIDLMQVHWPGGDSGETRRALETLLELRERSIVGAVGVCNFGVFDLDETKDLPIVSNQIPYNLLWRAVEGDDESADHRGIAAFSRSLGRTTIAYSALQQGLLTGRYEHLGAFPTGRRRTRHFSSTEAATLHSERGFAVETETALGTLLRAAETIGRPLLHLALSFVATANDIDTVLIGARDDEQLHASVDAAETSLSAEERELLETATAELKRAVGGHADMYQSESRIRFPGPDGAPIRRR